MEQKTIIAEQRDGILKIILNRPHVLNALSMEMIEELTLRFADTKRDDKVKVVIITGAGDAFSSGADISHISESKTFVREGCLKAQNLVRSIISLEKPVIAAVNGYATAGGCELALACDIRIASESAKFGELFIRIGLIPAMIGVYILPKLIGLSKAKEFIFTGDIIDAIEAERIGLVNRVVSSDQLQDTAFEMASRLARGPLKAIGKAKSAINRGLDSDLEGTLNHLAVNQIGLCETEDHTEGVNAFLKKRAPQFKGR
ncbi:MAG: enoyl-CoA hydratase/isomerase family protein [Thermodesulfobacteriota bacterium]|nr:enoyl-CoA hydratase/isomerase family protein [Thermodesulfobacteriota bacterium]